MANLGGLRWKKGQTPQPIAFVNLNVTWVGSGNTLLLAKDSLLTIPYHPSGTWDLMSFATAGTKILEVMEHSQLLGGLRWKIGQPL